MGNDGALPEIFTMQKYRQDCLLNVNLINDEGIFCYFLKK